MDFYDKKYILEKLAEIYEIADELQELVERIDIDEEEE